MRFRPRYIPPSTFRLALMALIWLVLISVLHYWLNFENESRPTVKMGYMPVITNLAAPLMDHASSGDRCPVRFQALKFASFAEMADALRNDDIQAAFIIAPLAIVLRQQGVGVKVVYIGNRHESTLVVRKDADIGGLPDLAGRKVAVPMRYSGHNLALLRQFAASGMADRVTIVEMNPPDMAAALAVGSLDAYFVGEPFAAQAVKSGHARVLQYVEELWPDFICNLLLVKQTLIETQPETVALLVAGAVRSGIWSRDNPEAASILAARYWNQPPALVTYAMTHPRGRIRFDRYTPSQSQMQELADLMVRFGLARSADINGLVDDRFAVRSSADAVPELAAIFDRR
jgi:NitT/TauT family transport system substrate-binding protein